MKDCYLAPLPKLCIVTFLEESQTQRPTVEGTVGIRLGCCKLESSQPHFEEILFGPSQLLPGGNLGPPQPKSIFFFF